MVGDREVDRLILGQRSYGRMQRSFEKWQGSGPDAKAFKYCGWGVNFDSSLYDISIAVPWKTQFYIFSWLKTRQIGADTTEPWTLHKFGSCEDCSKESYGNGIKVNIIFGDKPPPDKPPPTPGAASGEALGIGDENNGTRQAVFGVKPTEACAQFYILVDMMNSKDKPVLEGGYPIAIKSCKYPEFFLTIVDNAEKPASPATAVFCQPPTDLQNCVFELKYGESMANTLSKALLYWNKYFIEPNGFPRVSITPATVA